MTELSDWADQYRGELEKQSSTRAAQVESLLSAGDYEAIREWLDQWKAEDNARNSLYQPPWVTGTRFTTTSTFTHRQRRNHER